MATVSFGRSQMRNPSPAGLVFWVRLVTIISGIFMGWMQTASFIPSKSQAIISSILGLALALGNGVIPLFGVEVKTDSVPIEDVTAIETKK